MSPSLKKAYKEVIKDLRKERKCKESEIFCAICIWNRLADDLENVYIVIRE